MSAVVWEAFGIVIGAVVVSIGALKLLMRTWEKVVLVWGAFAPVLQVILIVLLLAKGVLSLTDTKGLGDNKICAYECAPGTNGQVKYDRGNPDANTKDQPILCKAGNGQLIAQTKQKHMFELIAGSLVVVTAIVISRIVETQIELVISAVTMVIIAFLLIASLTVNLNKTPQYFGADPKTAFGMPDNTTKSNQCLNLITKLDDDGRAMVPNYKEDTLMITAAYVVISLTTLLLSGVVGENVVENANF